MSLTATNAQVYKGTAAVTYKGAPTSNTALSLSGAAGNYILFPATHPTNFSPATSNVFIEAWVYWNNSVWTSSTGGGIYERENVGNTVQDFGMYTNSSGQLTAYMYTQNGSILRPIFNTALNVQQWYHVAFGYNTVNQTAYIWVNGSVGTTSTASNPARYTVTQTYIGFNPINMPSVYAWNGYIQDLRVFQGGVIPTTSFTPASASFGLANPTYVTGGTIVLSLATQYFQTNMKVTSGGSIQLYSRPVQTAVLVNPGSQTFTVGGTFVINQTALQPANGITWALAPTGQGVSVASSTDYTLTLSTPSSVSQNVFTVTATNKNQYTTLIQFVGATPILKQISTAAASSVVGVYSLRSLVSLYSKVVNIAQYNIITVTNWPPNAFTGFTSSTTYGTFTASASSDYTSVYGTGYEAWRAFNKITADPGGSNYSWATAQSSSYTTNGVAGVWLQLQCPVPVTLSNMILYGRTSDYGQNPTQIYLFGSNDGSTWTQLLGATSTTLQSVGGGPNTFTVNASTGYTYFRVVCTLPTGTGAMAIGEMYLNGTALTGSSNQDFYADTLGNLTTAAGSGQTLSNWLGSATGYVTTWYDQSGLGNHATQTNTTAQPVIGKGLKGPGYCLLYSGTQVMNAFSYSTLNGTNYSVVSATRRTASSGTGNNSNNTIDNPIWSCGLATGSTNAYPHFTYRGASTFQGQYGNDLGFTTITGFTTSSTEPIRYCFNMVSSTSGANQYIYNDPLGAPIKTNNTGLTGLLNMSSGSFNIGYNNFSPAQGSNPGMFYVGEYYEIFVFKASFFDTDGTSGTNVPTSVQTIYNNQVSYTGT